MVNLTKNFRLGFYEQIIGLSNASFSYMNPFQLYWSEQHQKGDVDNLQMGFDYDLIKGKNEHEAKEIVEDFLGMIKENPELKSEHLSDDEKTKLMCLSGVKQYPMRVKCATLSWHTMVSAFDEKTEEVKTEN